MGERRRFHRAAVGAAMTIVLGTGVAAAPSSPASAAINCFVSTRHVGFIGRVLGSCYSPGVVGGGKFQFRVVGTCQGTKYYGLWKTPSSSYPYSITKKSCSTWQSTSVEIR